MITTAMIAGGVVGGQCTINYDTRYSAHSGLGIRYNSEHRWSTKYSVVNYLDF